MHWEIIRFQAKQTIPCIIDTSVNNGMVCFHWHYMRITILCFKIIIQIHLKDKIERISSKLTRDLKSPNSNLIFQLDLEQACWRNRHIFDVSAAECIKGFQGKVFLQKISALKTKISAALQPPYNRLCPDMQTVCYNTDTCCRTRRGRYICCPLRSAVCCPGGRSCCPPGHICNMALGTCDRLFDRPSNDPACPEKKYQFPKKSFCCKLPSGTYGCCPLENAVKCSDLPCPLQKISALKTKISAALQPLYNRICPDMRTVCYNTHTCCRTRRGRYICCPLRSAVCCPGGRSCCPPGHICNMALGTCDRLFDRPSNDPACPEKKYQFPKKSFCCKLPSGTYGCCPLENAVKCSDHKHCCPEGYTCDEEAG